MICMNYIEGSMKHGIEVKGRDCSPIIKANLIEENMKSGIKVSGDASAYIGGKEKSDLNLCMNSVDNLGHQKLYFELFPAKNEKENE